MYDFNKREDFDYSHSYDYLGAMGLGRSEVEAETLRQSNLGRYDLAPVNPPEAADEIIKIATLFSKSKEREKLMEKITKIKDKKLEFVWDSKHINHPYFIWALHCIDRQVPNWAAIRASDKEPTTLLRVNDYVGISGIVARPELNDKIGRIVEKLLNDRFLVEFKDISQSVSIASRNCRKHNTGPPARTEDLPRGLPVEICKLTSDSGKLLNGRTAYILSREGDRYTVRLDGDVKSIKTENIHVPVPAAWEERIDESTGKTYYVNLTSAETIWIHPIYHNQQEEVDEGFDRNAFLRNESKRLKLDKREKFRGMKEGEIADQLLQMRKHWVSSLREPLFSGTPRELLSLIHESPEEKKAEWLFIAFAVILEDYKALKFNKSQLMALCAKIDEMQDANSFTPDIEAWIVAALQIAIPNSYIIN